MTDQEKDAIFCVVENLIKPHGSAFEAGMAVQEAAHRLSKICGEGDENAFLKWRIFRAQERNKDRLELMGQSLKEPS